MINLQAEKEDNDKSYVLMFDGKKVRTGGDLDLLGYEKGPSLHDHETSRGKSVRLIKDALCSK